MQKHTPSPEILAGATSLLMPFFPGITAISLLEALKQTEKPVESKTEKLLTKKEYAEKRGCSVMTVHRLIKDGKIPSVKISKRLVRIPSSALNIDFNKVGGQ